MNASPSVVSCRVRGLRQRGGRRQPAGIDEELLEACARPIQTLGLARGGLPVAGPPCPEHGLGARSCEAGARPRS
jgi:hypothetical protein